MTNDQQQPVFIMDVSVGATADLAEGGTFQLSEGVGELEIPSNQRVKVLEYRVNFAVVEVISADAELNGKSICVPDSAKINTKQTGELPPPDST